MLVPLQLQVIFKNKLGDNVTIDTNCAIYSSLIDDGVFIGAGSTVLEGTKIEKGAVIAPNSFLPPGRLIPGGQLWAGNPVKYVRDLKEEERFANLKSTLTRWEQSKIHMNEFSEENKTKNTLDGQKAVHEYLGQNYFSWRAKYH